MTSKLKKKLDKVFSEYIRKRDAKNGFVKCITCGVVRKWNDRIDAGHYISRSFLSTRFHEKNVHPQCKGCNGFRGGMLPEYTHYLTNRYGYKIIEDLLKEKQKLVKISPKEYEEKIKYYQNKLKNYE